MMKYRSGKEVMLYGLREQKRDLFQFKPAEVEQSVCCYKRRTASGVDRQLPRHLAARGDVVSSGGKVKYQAKPLDHLILGLPSIMCDDLCRVNSHTVCAVRCPSPDKFHSDPYSTCSFNSNSQLLHI